MGRPVTLLSYANFAAVLMKCIDERPTKAACKCTCDLADAYLLLNCAALTSFRVLSSSHKLQGMAQ